MGRGAGASVPKAPRRRPPRTRQASRTAGTRSPARPAAAVTSPKSAMTGAGPNTWPSTDPTRHRDRHRPEDQREPETHHPAHQRLRRPFLEERLARDDEDHVGDALPDGEAHRQRQVVDHREQEDEETPRRVAGDDHPTLRQARPDQADDEPADQVADADPGLEEAVRPLPAEGRVAVGQLDEARRQRDRDAETELADGPLERVGEEDGLVAQELPAGLHLGEEALAPGRRPRPRTAGVPGRRSWPAAPPTRGRSRCRTRRRSGPRSRGAPRRCRPAGSR